MPQKRYGLFVLAVLLFLLGAPFLASHNFTTKSIGFAASMAAIYLIRISNVRAGSAIAVTSDHASTRPGYLAWTVGFAMLLLAGVSYLLMYIDALHGGHTVWPLYLFAAAVLGCVGAWGYIASKLV